MNLRPNRGESSLPAKAYDGTLPIDKYRGDIVKSVLDSRVTVLVAETGSGKSTQVARFLAEDLPQDQVLTVGCTQPRRIAAKTLANYVASIVDQEKVGKVVSCFGNQKSLQDSPAKIVYTTDNRSVYPHSTTKIYVTGLLTLGLHTNIY